MSEYPKPARPEDSRDKRHSAAMALADRGDELRRSALGFYAEAAALEEQAANAVPVDQPRTRGVLRVSAASLWAQAERWEHATALIHRYLNEPLGEGFKNELRILLAGLTRG